MTVSDTLRAVTDPWILTGVSPRKCSVTLLDTSVVIARSCYRGLCAPTRWNRSTETFQWARWTFRTSMRAYDTIIVTVRLIVAGRICEASLHRTRIHAYASLGSYKQEGGHNGERQFHVLVCFVFYQYIHVSTISLLFGGAEIKNCEI